MSTIATSVTSSSTIILTDYYQRFRKHAGNRERMLVLKLSSVGVGVAGIQMYSLMRMVNDAEEHVTIESCPLHLGDRVRVNGGKLVGLEGNICREIDGSTSLVVKIDILGCAKVTIARELLEPIAEKKLS